MHFWQPNVRFKIVDDFRGFHVGHLWPNGTLSRAKNRRRGSAPVTLFLAFLTLTSQEIGCPSQPLPLQSASKRQTAQTLVECNAFAGCSENRCCCREEEQR